MGAIFDVVKGRELFHYGIKRRSGRYPWGSGENPYQHEDDFISRVNKLKDKGLTDDEIVKALDIRKAEYTSRLTVAEAERLREEGYSESEIMDKLGLKSTEYRTIVAVNHYSERSEKVAKAKELLADGYSVSEIAREMGYKNESSVRSLLNENSESRMNLAISTADFIKERVDSVGMVDVGAGVEIDLNISKERLNQALYILEMDGYELYGGRVPQVTNKGKQTTIRVICPPGTQHKEIYDYENIHSLSDYISYDEGKTFKKAFQYPESMDSSRLTIRGVDEGGGEMDGIIEIRPGVEDLSLGESKYAQVRILVDNDKYLKGLAVYSDDLPDGVDVRYNTGKKSDNPNILKSISDDPNNPFGSLIKEHGGQSTYFDSDGNEHLSLINKTREEGDWGDWSNTLPSQFLAKQEMPLITRQLDLSIENKQAEYDEILSLTNPTVKRYMLQSFADDCDSTAVYLDAAALPRQKYQVILPLTTISDDEIYAPGYRDGETVALIRYPHAGTFEIPILTVNNKQAEGVQKITSSALDAVGINSNVAAKLSGADFDGDTVMVIPCNSSTSTVHIKSSDALEGLKDFDPHEEYGGREPGTFTEMTKENTQTQMGIISNLIMDMTIKGASDEELARAVRHSMVIIDAYKWGLDWKASERDNGIAALKQIYQAHENDNGAGGASTLLTRSKSEVRVDKRRGSPHINEDGSVSYNTAYDLTWVDNEGKTHTRQDRSTRMAETSDAMTLVSDYQSPVELAYANYANDLKSMANSARKEMINTEALKRSPSAAVTYTQEVEDLKAQLSQAKANAPRERQAQLLANSRMQKISLDNPDMTKEVKAKRAQQELISARNEVGAKRTSIQISDSEWEAIQAGAISDSMLMEILDHTDTDKVKQLATPHSDSELSATELNKLKSMAASGYTIQEIADSLHISTSTVSRELRK